MYLVCTSDKSAYIADYCAAREQLPQVNHEILLFVDNVNRMAIPCWIDMDDKGLLLLLRIFYDLGRVRGGLLEFLGVKSSERIDIVPVLHHLSKAFTIQPC
jgi:hypothetical protein